MRGPNAAVDLPVMEAAHADAKAGRSGVPQQGYSPHTIRMYVDRVARFARHYGRSPAELRPEAVHAYQIHLLD